MELGMCKGKSYEGKSAYMRLCCTSNLDDEAWMGGGRRRRLNKSNIKGFKGFIPLAG